MKTDGRDVEFLYEIGSLRNIQRSWRRTVGMDVANVLEHTMRVVWLALILARREGVKNEEKIIKMALVHDIAESRTADHGYVQKVYVQEDSERATRDMLTGTTLEDFHSEILREYEQRTSIEAQIVKDADNLDIDLELRELEERGSKLPAKWKCLRRLVRDEKLYTDAARQLWDALDDVDVSDWHLVANKWEKMPEAGR